MKNYGIKTYYKSLNNFQRFLVENNDTNNPCTRNLWSSAHHIYLSPFILSLIIKDDR